MILVLAGLHGSGKSFLARHISAKFGWSVCVKREILKSIHKEQCADGDWVSWYRSQYELRGPGAVMRDVLKLLPKEKNIILDSVHNMIEWKEVLLHFPEATLAVVISPKSVRISRNSFEDEALDKKRIGYWHNSDDDCLVSESEWAFNGVSSKDVLNAEFLAFLSWRCTI